MNSIKDFYNLRKNAHSLEIRTDKIHRMPTISFQAIKRGKEWMKIQIKKVKRRKSQEKNLKMKKKMMTVTVIFEQHSID